MKHAATTMDAHAQRMCDVLIMRKLLRMLDTAQLELNCYPADCMASYGVGTIAICVAGSITWNTEANRRQVL